MLMISDALSLRRYVTAYIVHPGSPELRHVRFRNCDTAKETEENQKEWIEQRSNLNAWSNGCNCLTP